MSISRFFGSPSSLLEPFATPSVRDFNVCLTGAKTRYNLRVVETLVSARILARVLNLSLLSPGKNKKFTLREVLAAFLSVNEVKGTKEPMLAPEEVEAGLEKLLKEVGRLRGSVLRGEREHSAEDADQAGEEEGLTMNEMVRFSGLEEKEFKDVYLSWVDSTFSPFLAIPYHTGAEIDNCEFTP